jgi:hypothetical protein
LLTNTFNLSSNLLSFFGSPRPLQLNIRIDKDDLLIKGPG